MAGFLFRLETVDGAAADPPTLEAAVPNWKAGDSIYLRIGRFGWSAPATTMQTSLRC
jgi:hypothetical protein